MNENRQNAMQSFELIAACMTETYPVSDLFIAGHSTLHSSLFFPLSTNEAIKFGKLCELVHLIVLPTLI